MRLGLVIPAWAMTVLVAVVARLAVSHNLYLLEDHVTSFAVVFGALALATLLLADSRNALAIVMPAVVLATIGDVIAFRIDVTQGPVAEMPWLTGGEVLLTGLCAWLLLPRGLDAVRLTHGWKLIGAAGCLLCLLPLLPGVGVVIGDQRGWMVVAGVQWAPAEIGRVLVMLGFALGLGAGGAVPGRVVRDASARDALRGPLMLLGVGVAAQVAARDLGPTVVLIVSGALSMSVATGRARLAALGVTGVTALFCLGASLVPYIHGRLADAVNPLASADHFLTQAAAARMTLAWGGLGGTGLGKGLVNGPGALPAARTDLSLLIFAQEAGLIGLLMCLLLLGVLLHKGWSRIAAHDTGISQLTTATLWSMLTVQVIWTAAGVTGNLPHAGLTLPFISGGRSSAAAVATILGLTIGLSSREGRASARGPGLVLPRLAVASTLSLCAIAAATTITVNDQRELVNRYDDNPERLASTNVQGTVRALDGTLVQATTAPRSLDTARIWAAASPAMGGIVGPIMSDRGEGVLSTMRATLRCYESGQGTPAGPSWSEGAARVSGDPAECRPAGMALTLDSDLTDAADAALGEASGSIAIIDADTGAVRALAGRAPGASDAAPWMAMRAPLPPGSTMKLVTAAAALEAGIASRPWAATHIAQDGTQIAGSWCGGTLAQMLAVSCNQGFASIGEELGAERLADVGRRFGFGVSESLNGILLTKPTLVDDDTTPGLVATGAIGQGHALSTTLAMASVAQVIGGGGLRHLPYLVEAICGPEGLGVRERVSRTSVRAMTAANAASLQSMMEGVMAPGGTVASLEGTPWLSGVKSGTAEIGPREDLQTPAGNVAWLVGLTNGTSNHGPLAVAINLLPSTVRTAPHGGVEAAEVLQFLGPAIERYLASPAPPPCNEGP